VKAQYAAIELVQLALPELPKTVAGVIFRAKGQGWQFCEVKGEGGASGKRREYPLNQPALKHLIPILQEREALALLRGTAPAANPAQTLPAVAAAPAPQPAQLPAPARAHTPGATSQASTKNRAVGDARELLADEVTRLVQEHAYTERAAILLVLQQASQGVLRPLLQAAITQVRDGRGRKGAGNLVSYPTVARVLRKRREGASLVPIESAKPATPQAWHAFVYEAYRRNQKPYISQIYAALLQAWQPAWGAQAPSEDVVRHVIRKKFSRDDMNAGRHTGSALRSLRNYTPRTGDGYLPFEFVMADGWKTHFRAPHPVTKEQVTHEIWHFHDVVTRYVTPVSIGRSESSTVILKGIENCIRFGGRLRELYTDHTRSIKNAKVELDPVASVSARAGFTLKHPAEVGNSQANGIAESFNRYLDGEARELVTYQNPGVMDNGAFTHIGRWTGREVRAAKKGDTAAAQAARKQAEKHGKGLVFNSYEEGVAWINAKVDKFNLRPHRGLRQTMNPETGRRQHLSPKAALQQFIDEGWAPLAMDEASLVDLFRLHVRKRVTRCMVSPYNGQLYSHEALRAYTNSPGVPGEEVLVAIDPMDWERVWVKTLAGKLICEAKFVAATGYSTLTAQEAAQEKLMAAQIRGKEVHIERIRAEMGAAPVVDMPALPAPTAQVLEIPLSTRRQADDEDRPLSFLDTFIKHAGPIDYDAPLRSRRETDPDRPLSNWERVQLAARAELEAEEAAQAAEVAKKKAAG
jgi:putative transposase